MYYIVVLLVSVGVSRLPHMAARKYNQNMTCLRAFTNTSSSCYFSSLLKHLHPTRQFMSRLIASTEAQRLPTIHSCIDDDTITSVSNKNTKGTSRPPRFTSPHLLLARSIHVERQGGRHGMSKMGFLIAKHPCDISFCHQRTPPQLKDGQPSKPVITAHP